MPSQIVLFSYDLIWQNVLLHMQILFIVIFLFFQALNDIEGHASYFVFALNEIIT